MQGVMHCYAIHYFMTSHEETQQYHKRVDPLGYMGHLQTVIQRVHTSERVM